MLTIGQVAARTGLRPSTIRYYESQRLLPEPLRRAGKRLYDESIVERLAVIELAKTAGCHLHEIRAMLSDVGDGPPASGWRTLATAKRMEIEAEMKRLADAQYVLARLSACACATLEDCGRTFMDVRSKRPHARVPADPKARRGRFR